MSLLDLTQLLGLICLFLGALLCLVASVGLLRFPDLLTRMHAGTKPQVLGVLLIALGVGLRRDPDLEVGMLTLVVVFQLLTIPAGAHMVSRAAVRTGQVAPSDIHVGPRSRSLAQHRTPEQPGA